MKTLVEVGENLAWVSPEAIDAVVTTGAGALLIFSSGEKLTLPGMDADKVMDLLLDSIRRHLEIVGPEDRAT